MEFSSRHQGMTESLVNFYVSRLLIVTLNCCRLFYAGACEGQMPEILTMIQVSRLTPTPAVLCIALLSLVYLASDNVYSLINYVGFATWVSLPFQ